MRKNTTVGTDVSCVIITVCLLCLSAQYDEALKRTMITPPTITVYTRSAWAAAWTERTGLYALNLTDCAAPEVPVATLRYDYGKILRHAATTFSAVSPLDLLDDYVRIKSSDSAIDWVGVITDVSDAPHGNAVQDPAGSLTLTARGMIHLLDRVTIHTAPSFAASGEITIDHVPTFNLPHKTGGSFIGNRSTDVGAGGYYYFDSVTGGETWTVSEILDTLIGFYAPSGPTWEMSGQYADLAGVADVIDVSGITLKQALDTIIDRRRGYAYNLAYDSANDKMLISVFSELTGNITVDGNTYNANSTIHNLDLRTDTTVGALQLRDEASARYDTVRVEGARIKVCCTIPVASLEEGWSEDQEDAYLAGASGAADYAALPPFLQMERNDEVRKQDALRRVFAFFRIPDTWGGECGLLGTDDAAYTCDDDGAIGNGGPYPAWIARPILDFIPLKEGVDYSVEAETDSNPSGAEPELRKPFVIAKNFQGRYIYADQPSNDWFDTPSAHVEAAQRERGLWIRFTPQHVAAKNHWAAAEPTEVEPAYDYLDMIATICIPIDERLVVEVDAAGAPLAEYERKAVIRLPDAEAWIVAAGTIVGIDDTGALQTVHAELLIRSDAPRLRAIANLAAEWFCTSRAAVNYMLNGLSYDCALGEMIGTIQTGDARTITCNACITRVSWDFDALTTVYETHYWGVDWAAVAPVNAASVLTARQLAAQHQNEATELAQAQNLGSES